MRFKIVTAAVLALSMLSFALPIELEVKSLLDDKIEIKIPRDFTIMDKEMLELKYPSANRPKLVYTNEAGSINVAFTHSTSQIAEDQLEEFLGVLKKGFKSAQKNVEILSDGVKEVNGKKLGFVEVITHAVDTKVYNMIFFTDVGGKLLICSFNCTEKYLSEWKSVGSEIVSSLKVK